MKDDKFLTERELLQIYGITHPQENMGNKTNQRQALMRMKYCGGSNYEPIIKNKYLRWGLIITFIIIMSLIGAWLFTEFSDGLFSWQRTL